MKSIIKFSFGIVFLVLLTIAWLELRERPTQEKPTEGNIVLGTSQSGETRTIRKTNTEIELVAVDGDCKLFRIKQDGVGSRYVYWSICTNGRNSALTTTNY